MYVDLKWNLTINTSTPIAPVPLFLMIYCPVGDVWGGYRLRRPWLNYIYISSMSSDYIPRRRAQSSIPGRRARGCMLRQHDQGYIPRRPAYKYMVRWSCASLYGVLRGHVVTSKLSVFQMHKFSMSV